MKLYPLMNYTRYKPSSIIVANRTNVSILYAGRVMALKMILGLHPISSPTLISSCSIGIGWVKKMIKVSIMPIIHLQSVKPQATILPLDVANALESNQLKCCIHKRAGNVFSLIFSHWVFARVFMTAPFMHIHLQFVLPTSISCCSQYIPQYILHHTTTNPSHVCSKLEGGNVILWILNNKRMNVFP